MCARTHARARMQADARVPRACALEVVVAKLRSLGRGRHGGGRRRWPRRHVSEQHASAQRTRRSSRRAQHGGCLAKLDARAQICARARGRSGAHRQGGAAVLGRRYGPSLAATACTCRATCSRATAQPCNMQPRNRATCSRATESAQRAPRHSGAHATRCAARASAARAAACARALVCVIVCV